MELVVAERQGPHGVLLIVTDAELLGKKFEEGKAQLDLTQEFYRGDKLPEEELRRMLPAAQHLHLTGKAAVALGIELGLVDGRRVLWVQGVPHAEVVGG